MTHGAPHDAAEHIAAPLVRGQHAVGDEEARGAQVIGYDAVAGAVRPRRRHADNLDRGIDQGAEEVDVVIVVDALEHGSDALEPHAGVDRRLGQVDPLAARQLLELHEDEIPDLDEAVAVGVGTAGRPARDVGAMVVEDLGARAAGAGVAHRPEIVAGRDADDAVVAEAGDLPPEVEGVVVLGIDGDQQPVLGEAELLGDELPGKLDGALLEIVAEGEIAEHLEEGVMPRRVADILEIVVLAAGAHRLLRGGRPRERRLGTAGEIVLERDHAGIGEHQRRIVPRDERPRRQWNMAVILEEIEKTGTNIIDAIHGPIRAVGPGGSQSTAGRWLFTAGIAILSRITDWGPPLTEGRLTVARPQ